MGVRVCGGVGMSPCGSVALGLCVWKVFEGSVTLYLSVCALKARYRNIFIYREI